MNITVTEKEIQKMRHYPKLNKGKEGICYFINHNTILKLFHEEYIINKLVDSDVIKEPEIAYPIDVLYNQQNKLIGYTMNYLEGQKFINGFPEELTLTELKNIYLKTRILMLKIKDIYMDDNCLENMLLDPILNKINLIDTSRWYEKENGQIDNINEFNWQMMNALLKNINWKHFKLNHDKKLFELHMTYTYLENITSLFGEFLNELELKVSEYKGYKVKTIKDLII